MYILLIIIHYTIDYLQLQTVSVTIKDKSTKWKFILYIFDNDILYRNILRQQHFRDYHVSFWLKCLSKEIIVW